MKRYTKTFWNGMLEDPKGEWVKEKDACEYLDSWISKSKKLEKEVEYNLKEWKALYSEYSNERIKFLILSAGFVFSAFFNIFQFLIK